MSEPNVTALSQAIATISQADPIVALLRQVTLGRMKPTDSGLRAITESWIGTYQKVIERTSLSRLALLQLDPRPRIEFLVNAGVLDPSHEAAQALGRSFEQRLAEAPLD